MTALKKYQRLECPGLWRPTPEMQRREVIVSFREASLILSDPKNEQALSHWSLPAVERLNPNKEPALYAPGGDDGETLEIEDRDMIAALATVRGALEAAKPRPGRLRNVVLCGITVLVIAAGFLMPAAVVSHTVSVVPSATRIKIGEMALAELVHLTGAPCTGTLGREASENLSRRIFGDWPSQILIVRDGLRRPIHLPNRQIIVPRSLVEDQDNPAPLAGYALAERARADAVDPLLPLLTYAGTAATLRLLTTGTLPASALDGYAEELLAAEPTEVSAETLLPRFASAEVPSTPYARVVGNVSALIDNDPWPAGPPQALLPDEDWVSLSAICQD